MLEFVLVGIPMIFIFISIFEISRGMWTYHNLAYAIREGVRYASMRGRDCGSPNNCQVTIGTIAGVIESAGVGLDPSLVTLTFTPANGSGTTGTITTLLSSSTVYPPSGSNNQGQYVSISGVYSFKTVLAVLWPGDGKPYVGNNTFALPASSNEPIQY